MAKFIGLINNGGSFKGEKGETMEYNNFTFHYADEVSPEDKVRGDEISSSLYRPYSVEKIPGNKIAQFMGVSSVPNCEIFNGCFGADIELKFGRTGVCGIRFITIDPKTGEVKPRDILNEVPFTMNDDLSDFAETEKEEKNKSKKA